MEDMYPKRRIVMVGTSFDTMGGISSVVKGYASEGFLDRLAIRYVVTHKDGSSLQKLSIATRGILRLLYICALKRNLLVHIHLSSRASFWRKSICCLICRFFGHPYILHVHGSEFMEFYQRELSAPSQAFVRFILGRSACILALSESWKGNLASIVPAARIEVVRNAVPLAEIREAEEDQRRAVLFLGRLGPRKGVSELVRAFATIADDFPTIDLVCAGDGDIEATREQASRLGLGERVLCPGWLRGDDKQKTLSRAIVFALPSHAEGLPMALLEAMSAGLPVLASSVGGIPEVVRHGVEGYLIEPGDEAALAGFLRTLLEDEPGRQQLSRNSRLRIEESYALPRVIERIESIYQGIS